ncbi:T-cell surface glycoprotein CD1b3-like [Dryobates pubescens]|uniref:T-cell surface glycoprotein CD1b3-like n=1 Tax=Dryobates pubescens TaxID=118200 RepID=UPI0023B96E2C|nr:T-cell surface glycoprotein CD1b3-like [Dryobates pubescens]
MPGTLPIWLLQTSTFQNSSFVDMEWLGLLEDNELGSVDRHTWTIHFCQPWVYQALPCRDWHSIDNMIKAYLQQFNHVFHEGAMQKEVPYPFVIQCMAGCKIYPNRTSQAFISVGYNGLDFFSFDNDADNGTWLLCQDSSLLQYVLAALQSCTVFRREVAGLFKNTCVDGIEVLLSKRKAALEGQVFARTPSPGQLLLVCRVTGFYPRPVSVAWLRDGQEVPPGPALNTSSVLPNAASPTSRAAARPCPPGWAQLCLPRSSEAVLIAGLGAGLPASVAVAAIVVLRVWRRSLAACTMQPPHLFLFLSLLLPGMWADPEAETKVFQVLKTSLFINSSSAEVSGVALLRDIPIYTMDHVNWTLYMQRPWAWQAAAEGDAVKIAAAYKTALRNMIRYTHETARDLHMDYPFVIQIHAGCAVYPNETAWGFMDVGADGRDLVAFKTERTRWEAQQLSPLAQYLSKSLNKNKSVMGLLEHLLTIFCKSHVLTLYRYGKADLERQEPPVATVFARTPSPGQLLLVCRVTGFYPQPISVAWLRDGQEVPPGPALNTSSVLPNADLTYQLRSCLAVPPRDGHSYACRVRHSSLGTRSLLIPWENHSPVPTVGIAAAVLLLVAIASAGGIWWWKSRKSNGTRGDNQEFII